MISNFYPPDFIGGYELGCSRVVTLLQQRGHDCHVLTSNYGATSSTDCVERKLRHWMKGRAPQRLGRLRAVLQDQANRAVVKETINRIGPDLIYIWNPMFLSLGVLHEAQLANRPVSFYVSDEWPRLWQSSENSCWQRLNDALKFTPARILAKCLSTFRGTGSLPTPLALDHCQFASDYLFKVAQSAGFGLKDGIVAHWGVKRMQYLMQRIWTKPARRFLYAGQISEHKGVHTALEAFGILCNAQPKLDLHLTLAGQSRDVLYETRLSKIISRFNLEKNVHRPGRLSEPALCEAYKSHDALLFTSIWNEPFSIALVEAMSSGLAVVSTLTGGTGELVCDGVNGLVFEAGSAEACARQLERLAFDVSLCERLSIEAIASTSALTLDNLVDTIEGHLLQLVHQTMNLPRIAMKVS